MSNNSGRQKEEEKCSTTKLQGSRDRIMIIDDEADITSSLKIQLEDYGFIVDRYNDPIEVLSTFKPGSYDLLLIDVRMPKMNGFELYQEIKKKDDKIKVCFITGYEVFYESLKSEF